MSILCIDLFIFGGDINLEITVCLPATFQQFYLFDFFLKDGVANNTSKKAVAYVFVFLVEVHECSEEDGEVNDVRK